MFWTGRKQLNRLVVEMTERPCSYILPTLLAGWRLCEKFYLLVFRTTTLFGAAYQLVMRPRSTVLLMKHIHWYVRICSQTTHQASITGDSPQHTLDRLTFPLAAVGWKTR